FFFQAEDGIRDRNVTGVQTCALPISSYASSTTTMALNSLGLDVVASVYEAGSEFNAIVVVDEAYEEFSREGTQSALTLLPDREQIGRASCRERGWGEAGGERSRATGG